MLVGELNEPSQPSLFVLGWDNYTERGHRGRPLDGYSSGRFLSHQWEIQTEMAKAF